MDLHFGHGWDPASTRTLVLLALINVTLAAKTASRHASPSHAAFFLNLGLFRASRTSTVHRQAGLCIAFADDAVFLGSAKARERERERDRLFSQVLSFNAECTCRAGFSFVGAGLSFPKAFALGAASFPVQNKQGIDVSDKRALAPDLMYRVLAFNSTQAISWKPCLAQRGRQILHPAHATPCQNLNCQPTGRSCDLGVCCALHDSGSCVAAEEGQWPTLHNISWADMPLDCLKRVRPNNWRRKFRRPSYHRFPTPSSSNFYSVLYTVYTVHRTPLGRSWPAHCVAIKPYTHPLNVTSCCSPGSRRAEPIWESGHCRDL